MLETRLQPKLSALTFRGLKANADFYERLSLPVISTGRSFAYYRKIFFGNRSAKEVLKALQGKCVIDVGCGLTPYVSDSMFQVCHRKGIEFYGVDPKFSDGVRLRPWDIATIRAVGGRGRISSRSPGLEKCLDASADDIPLEDGSVDLILSNFLLYAWIQDEDLLTGIFREFHRLLGEGGDVRIYPAPYFDIDKIKHADLQSIMQQFDIRQRFCAKWLNLGQYPPAYITTMRKIGNDRDI